MYSVTSPGRPAIKMLSKIDASNHLPASSGGDEWQFLRIRDPEQPLTESGRMALVNTVLGPIDTFDMGFTLCHEHVMTGSAGVAHSYPELVDRAAITERAAADLTAACEGGVSTFVDLTTFDLGRDVRLIRDAAERSGVQIIVATGTWLEVPRTFWQFGPDLVSKLYIRELEQGIDGTDIKAGVIKVANDEGGVTERGEVVLRAAARAHLATGAPIFTHTWAPERIGERQIAIFEQEGVDLTRVCIGHSNDTTELDYLLGILDKGCWLGLDRYPGGARNTPDWRERTRVVKDLIDAGRSDRILLSHDHTVFHGIISSEAAKIRRRDNPDGYLFISRHVLPYLEELGTGQDTIRQIMTDNPRRYFEG